MRLGVLFFASLRDEVGTAGLTLEVDDSGTLEALFESLSTQLPASAIAALRAENVRLAVNQQLVVPPLRLVAGDEIAFLPPVTGG